MANKKLTVPAGTDIKASHFYCPKHGIVTNNIIIMDSITKKKFDPDEKCNGVFCLSCLFEYLKKLEANGDICKVTSIPVFGPKS